MVETPPEAAAPAVEEPMEHKPVMSRLEELGAQAVASRQEEKERQREQRQEEKARRREERAARNKEIWATVTTGYENLKGIGTSAKETAGGLIDRLGKFKKGLVLKTHGAMTPEGRAIISESAQQRASAIVERVSNGTEAVWNTARQRTSAAGERLAQGAVAAVAGAQEAGAAILRGVTHPRLRAMLEQVLTEMDSHREKEESLNLQEEQALQAIRERFEKQRNKLQQQRDKLEARAEQLRTRLA